MTRASRPLAGHWPVDCRWPFVVVAATSLYCCACQTSGKAPLPRDGQAPYHEALARFLAEHKDHEPEREGGRP